MKAKFINEDFISITPDTDEERILFNRFVRLVASKEKVIANNPTYSMGAETEGKYTNLGLVLMSPNST